VKPKTEKILGISTTIIIILIIIGTLNYSRIKDGFTTVDVLTDKYIIEYFDDRYNFTVINLDLLTVFIREDTKYTHSGAICNDGWVSHSTGRGTCSHHGGVRKWFSKGDYSITIEESKVRNR
jgi:hypothetical protein